MTAFASSDTDTRYGQIHCELRTVNHRYCDISIRLPERFRFTENQLRSLLGKNINRGKVECTINYKKTSLESSAVQINEQAVNAILTSTAKIEAMMTSPKPFSALDILSFPGAQQEPEIDSEQLQQALAQVLDLAIIDLLKMRQREGQQLSLLMQQRCQQMQILAEQAKKRMPEVLQLIRERIIQRIETLVAEPDFDRIEQEMVLLTQKLDVAEELDRLETHITEVSNVLQQDQPVGRRLDFLMQEMNREANTLGSKSADKAMTQYSIELKVLIEQMREQVQNIE
jgi:uncharacterized protein (TIGR00255 family)